MKAKKRSMMELNSDISSQLARDAEGATEPWVRKYTPIVCRLAMKLVQKEPWLQRLFSDLVSEGLLAAKESVDSFGISGKSPEKLDGYVVSAAKRAFRRRAYLESTLVGPSYATWKRNNARYAAYAD